MGKVVLPTNGEPLVEKGNLVALPWQIAFEDLASGDLGNSWTPIMTNLTFTGVPTITGRYFFISKKLVFFVIQIVPATDTSAVAGTTYCGNFPLNITANSTVLASLGAAGGVGGIDAASKRIYPPTWAATGSTVTLTGILEVS